MSDEDVRWEMQPRAILSPWDIVMTAYALLWFFVSASIQAIRERWQK